MAGTHVTRRRFVAAGTALVAVSAVPAWADTFQQGPEDDALRAEAAEAALSRAAALGRRTPTSASTATAANRSPTREQQVQNVSRSTSCGLGLRVLVNGAWGFAATNRVEPAAARAAAEQAVASPGPTRC